MYHERVRPSISAEPVPFLDFSRQYGNLSEEILSAIAHVCRSQRFILGPEVGALEETVRQACQANFAIGCASGTDALWLAFAAARIGDSHLALRSTRQDAVITSPFSFFASASAILRAGARPVFADIDPVTFNLSPESTETVLSQNGGVNQTIQAVLPVHLFGQPADFTAFQDLQNKHPHLRLIEDAAQAFGAAWTFPDGTSLPAGALGDAAAFSFYPTKNLSAFGDAGLLTCRTAAIADAAKSLRAHGMTRRYYHDEVGWNSRLDTLQAAVLEVKLRYLPLWNDLRRAIAARYDELFLESGIAVQTSHAAPRTTADGVVLPSTHPSAHHVFHQYVIRAPRRNALREHLSALGIGSEVYYPLCLHQQDALKPLGYRTGDFPHAERAAAEVLALPIYPELRDDEQQSVVEAIRQFYS
jgi:dTDP-4-amino-4,6-dideoxygalactose transaminase